MTMLALLLPLIFAPPVFGAFSVSLGAIAAPTETEARKVSLRIEHSRLLEQESEASVLDTVSYIRQDGIAALREKHGVEVVDAAGAPTIIVALSWIRHDDSVYGVTIHTRRPGEEPRELETFECECIDSGLTKAVLERLPAALERLEEPAAAEPGRGPAAEPAKREAEPAVTNLPSGPTSDRQRRPLGALGKAGIGLLSGGAAAAVAGGVVFLQGRQLDNPSDPGLEPSGRNFRPPGIAVMVTGGVLAATGVALLVTDRLRVRNPRSSSARVRVLPGGSSIVLTAKF